jgi:hypothetical protein
LPEEDITTIARAFIDIFPSLSSIRSNRVAVWDHLSSRVSELQGTCVTSSK